MKVASMPSKTEGEKKPVLQKLQPSDHERNSRHRGGLKKFQNVNF